MKDKDSVTVTLEREEIEALSGRDGYLHEPPDECEHGFRPPDECPNEDCSDRLLRSAWFKLRAALNASPQSSDEPRCGGSGKLSVGVNEDFDTGALEADDEKDCPGCPDCQPSDEEAGEGS